MSWQQISMLYLPTTIVIVCFRIIFFYSLYSSCWLTWLNFDALLTQFLRFRVTFKQRQWRCCCKGSVKSLQQTQKDQKIAKRQKGQKDQKIAKRPPNRPKRPKNSQTTKKGLNDQKIAKRQKRPKRPKNSQKAKGTKTLFTILGQYYTNI